MPKFTVMKSYTVIEIHQVEADSAEVAPDVVMNGLTSTFVKSFDDDYDDEVTVEEGWEYE